MRENKGQAGEESNQEYPATPEIVDAVLNVLRAWLPDVTDCTEPSVVEMVVRKMYEEMRRMDALRAG